MFTQAANLRSTRPQAMSSASLRSPVEVKTIRLSVIAQAIMRLKADGAINFTASHNPPEYNGIKFSTPDGAPALPEVTGKIEDEIARLRPEALVSAPDQAEAIEVKSAYLQRLGEIIDLDAIRKAKLRIAFDPFW